MIGSAQRGLCRAVGEATYLIDSTGRRLSAMSAEWARFSAGICGAKVHVICNADAERPNYGAVTAARVNDISSAQVMPIEAGTTYVFDLGYYGRAGLDTAAQDIADLHKRCWAIELFFRWVKQTLKNRHFLWSGENAVRIQIAVALMPTCCCASPRPTKGRSQAC